VIDFGIEIRSRGAGESVAHEAAHLMKAVGDPRRVLSLTYFTNAGDSPVVSRQFDEIRDVVVAVSDGAPPPVTLVAQAPEGGHRVALEAVVLSPGDGNADVVRRRCGDRTYSVVTSGGLRQVHAGGLFAADPAADTTAGAEAAFAAMEAILAAEGMDYGHVVRQWNYIEGMLEVENGGRQRYQDFNDVRSARYATSEFPHGYPAATGIGQVAGGVVLEFIAVDAPDEVEIAPVSNPRQIDAHRYSEGVLVGEVVAKTSPKFERAKRVARDGTETVFVSGTASIIGEESVAIGDVAAQTTITLENIATLTPDGSLSSLRAYVKQAEDIPAVRAVCESALGDIPALYVHSDVCRDELLVEIEGISVTRRNAGAAS